MDDRFRSLRAATESAVLRGAGTTDPALRQAVARGEPPEDLRPIVEKIRRAPYAVTDADLSALASHYGEEQLFELVIAAAIGAAGERLDAGLRALEEA